MAASDLRCDVLVVGAGIIGLAAAYELRERGVDAQIVEAGLPGCGQSNGQGRIFRVAHSDPDLVCEALKAWAAWRVWESRAGAELLGDEGLLLLGDERISTREQAMKTAGADHKILDGATASRMLGAQVNEPALLDSLAGTIDMHDTVAMMAASLGWRTQFARVDDVWAQRDRALAVTSRGERWQARRVLLCAGHGTHALASKVGIDDDGSRYLERHARFTFSPYQDAEVPSSCLIDDEAYCLPIERRSAYAVGLHGRAAHLPADTGWAQVEAQALEATADYVQRRFPSLDPSTGKSTRCEVGRWDWLPTGDGWRIRQEGPVIAVIGGNLAKFAPLIGQQLADAAMPD